MKARVKKTGEIVELADDCYLNDKDYEHSYYADELESVECDYWDKLKHQYAGMAMQGILANPNSELDYTGDEALPQALAGCAAKLAHSLVEKLKNE